MSASSPPPASDPERAQLQAELDAWLHTEPAAELGREIHALHVRVGGLLMQDAFRLPESSAVALVERLGDAGQRLKARLSVSELPLSGELHRAVRTLVAAHLDAAALHAQGLAAEDAGRLVFQAGLLAAMGGGALPAEVWAIAYGLGDGALGADGVSALLALGATQPESLTPRELLWLEAYLAEHGEALVPCEAVGEAGGFWYLPSTDPARARAPVSVRRQSPPPGARVFSTAALGQRAADQLAWLNRDVDLDAAEDEGEDVGGLPAGLTADEAAALLERLRCYWALPPRRGNGRESAEDPPVSVCVGLRALRGLLSGRAASERARWQVLNRSERGMALASSEVEGEHLLPGTVLGLREADQAWRIYMLRWLHSPAPGHAEIGVQWLADRGEAAAVYLPRSETPGERIPAIVLEVEGEPALLVPPGCLRGADFELERDGVRQAGRSGDLLLRVAGAELYRFSLTR